MINLSDKREQQILLVDIAGGNGLDIEDYTFDFLNYFECYKTFKECNDYYDKLMLVFGLNIKVESGRDGFACCHISEFLREHHHTFKNFMIWAYREDSLFNPKNWEKDYTIDDEEFYDTYLDTFKDLINGNFSDTHYKNLYEMLVEAK